MIKIIIFFIGIFFIGCSHNDEIDKKILTPEKVEIYEIKVESLMPQIHNGKKLLHQFPFISYKSILDFNGKFSYQFYDKIDYRYKASSIDKVDFWKLRHNPFMYDFIYVLPIWINEFKKVSNDLYKNIGFTYNLSSKEQEILKWWIKEGGILWVESAIYSTRYDTFKKDGEIDETSIQNKMLQKTKHLTFLNHKVYTYTYKNPKIDIINYKPATIEFKTSSKIDYFSDIKTLKLQTDNYLTAYLQPKGEVLVKNRKNNRPLVTFLKYGKGGIVFLRDFEFEDKRFDGELLRWKLISYLLEKKYIKKRIPTKLEEQLNNHKVVIRNPHFAYKSYELTKYSKKLLTPIIDYMKKYPNKKIRIVGYTDNIGSEEYNKILSLNRAISVKNYFIEKGISSNRLSVYGAGESHPIKSNETERGRLLNRRVEFKILN